MKICYNVTILKLTLNCKYFNIMYVYMGKNGCLIFKTILIMYCSQVKVKYLSTLRDKKYFMVINPEYITFSGYTRKHGVYLSCKQSRKQVVTATGHDIFIIEK